MTCVVPPLQDTTTAPTRSDVLLFGATTTLSVPLSAPDDAPEKVTHGASVDAAQAQLPPDFVIATSSVVASAFGDCDVGDAL
jgi:hypothetical protein